MLLIVPAAGKSSRFSVGRPKWLLQHPTGVTMIEKAIQGFSNFDIFDEIVMVTTERHLEGVNSHKITEEVSVKSGKPCRFFSLAKQTNSVVETVVNFLESVDVDVPFVVKDCDNFVSVDSEQLSSNSNAIVFADLHDFPNVSAPSKSFIELGAGGLLENFVEKRIVSSLFSVGVAKFSDASGFLLGAKTLVGSSTEIYVSDVVRSMMQQGVTFAGIKTEGYEDWGTLERWQALVRSYATLFIDIDGVLVENAGRVSSGRDWSSFVPLEENLSALLALQSSGRIRVIFTTSRSEEFRSQLEHNLVDRGFRTPEIIMSLPHAPRIVVNDFSPTNPFPSASAVSVERNTRNVRAYLGRLFE